MKVIYMYLTLLVSVAVMPNLAVAGSLVRGATVVAVSNSSGNQPSFTLRVKDGTGPCANKSITFPATEAGNPRIYARAYKAALTACVENVKVSISNYSDSSCRKAAYIEIYRLGHGVHPAPPPQPPRKGGHAPPPQPPRPRGGPR